MQNLLSKGIRKTKANLSRGEVIKKIKYNIEREEYKIPYGIDSFILIKKNPCKRLKIFGKKDRAFLLTEHRVNKKRKTNIKEKVSKWASGNKDGKRYYIEYTIYKLDIFGFGDTIKEKSKFLLSFKQAENIGLRRIRNNNNMHMIIYEETKIDGEWVSTDQYLICI